MTRARSACEPFSACPLLAALLFSVPSFAAEPHPDELTFVTPSATTRVSETERCFSMGGSASGGKVKCPPRSRTDNAELMRGEPRASYPSEFPGLTSPRVIAENAYLPVDRGFFNKIRSMACHPKGGLWITSTAWLKRNNNPYASGIWQVAADGQITALAAKPWALETSRLYPNCNAPFQKSGTEVRDLTRLTPATGGSMLAISADSRTILRIQSDGNIQYVAGGGSCAAPAARSEGYVDGSVEEARFKRIDAAFEDPQKNIWVGDFGNCALRKISGGRVSTVVPPERACPKNDPENRLTYEHLAWDPNSGELIAAGTHLWRGPPTGDNFFSSVWRVTTDGAIKRLYLVRAMGSGPNTGFGEIGGMALDRAGTIWIAQGFYEGTGEGYRIARLEAGARAVRVAGSPLPVNVDHGDGPVSEALFDNDMTSMCFDPQGMLFIHVRNMIRKMTPNGRVTSWAY